MNELERKQVQIDEGLDNLSRYLDGLFRVPGTGWRFGLDALIGLIPNVGDTPTMFPSFYILVAGVRYGVPKITLLRMAFNIGLEIEQAEHGPHPHTRDRKDGHTR